jgi:hypothetical protein
VEDGAVCKQASEPASKQALAEQQVADAFSMEVQCAQAIQSDQSAFHASFSMSFARISSCISRVAQRSIRSTFFQSDRLQEWRCPVSERATVAVLLQRVECITRAHMGRTMRAGLGPPTIGKWHVCALLQGGHLVKT